MEPWEAAQALFHLEGLVFLDTATHEPGGRSIVAARPSRILTGDIHRDWIQVENALAAGAGSSGGLIGWVEFDGAYTFGVFADFAFYDHDSRAWTMSPLLEEAMRVPLIHEPPLLDFRPLIKAAEFKHWVKRAQEYIAAGDIYQVNLSHPWRAEWPAHTCPLAFYERLRAASPAPFAAYLNLNGQRIFSASPECFLSIRGRDIETRPIKGTRPRFADRNRDEQSLRELLASAKEQAELLMITDLERNDLGMACEYGSVDVPTLASAKAFAQVFHLVSTVRGRLREGISHAEAFRRCFPGGSITGAPKKRAVEIIREIETYSRGLYTGAIGYFGFGGESQFSIAIRTAIQSGNQISFHAGAGIVADSDPRLEYEETLHKAEGLLRAGRALREKKPRVAAATTGPEA